MPRWRDAPQHWSIAEELKKKGYSEGTVGTVQTFFLRTDDGPWTAERLAALAPVDTVIHLSQDVVSRDESILERIVEEDPQLL